MIFPRWLLHVFLWVLMSSVIVRPAVADDLQEYFNQGQQAYQQGDYEKAAQLYEKVVELDPNYAPAYNALGLTYKGLNAGLEDITWLFKVATEIDPNYIEAYENQCKMYHQAGQYDEAEKNCLKILSINPNYGSTQLILGWIYLGKSQPNHAVRYFEAVLKKVKVPSVYYGLGLAYAQSGSHAQVLETVTQLRNLGEVQMAAQLENMIRTKQPPPPPPSIVVPEKQPGTLVPSSTVAASAPALEAAASPSAGSMRVRLRGKLGGSQTNVDGSSQAGLPEAVYGDNRSAIERIRALQQRRMGLRPQSGY